MSRWRPVPIKQRLADAAKLDPETGCLVWQRYIGTHGYGVLQITGGQKLAHRLAWETSNGPIPDGLYVCHRCDRRACINVDHMFLGTPTDNARDMIRKGRNASLVPRSGEDHPGSKLSEEDVRKIRLLYEAGFASQPWLSAHMGVSQVTISRIVRQKIWRTA
jgi:HNH endonuclease